MNFALTPNLAGPFALLLVGGALTYHLLESHRPLRERLDAQHVFRGYAVIGHLGHTPGCHTQMCGQGLVASSLGAEPVLEIHGASLDEPKSKIKNFLNGLVYDSLKP